MGIKRSTRTSRAMGLALAAAGVVVGLAVMILVPPSIIGNGWHPALAAVAYYGALLGGLAFGALSGLAILHWIDTRRTRHARH